MHRFSSITAALLCSIAPALAQFSGFTSVPAHPGPGINLAWTGPGGTININRWVDGGSPTPINTCSSCTTYTDSTAVANTLYYYSVSQAGASSTTAQAVVSDITAPFICPYVQPVDHNLIGIDRTVSFFNPNGLQSSFTISAPRPTTTITIPPSGDTSGITDFTNIANALTFGGGGSTASSRIRIQLTAGHYWFTPPNTINGFAVTYNINFNVASDAIIAGAGKSSTILHFYPTRTDGTTVYGIAVPGGTRNMVQDFSIVLQVPNAIPGVVTTSGGNQIFTPNNPTYYIPNPANPPLISGALGGIYGYTTGGTFDLRPGSRTGIGGTFNPSYPSGGYFYNISGISFPNNTPAIGWVFFDTTGGPKELFHLADTNNMTIANVGMYGWASGGIQMVGNSSSSVGGLWVVNSNMTTTPPALLQPGEQPRLISTFGDNDVNSTMGNTLIENSEFAFVGDDAFAFAGGFIKKTATVVSTQEVTFTSSSPITNHTPSSNDLFQFYDTVNLQPLGGPQIGTWTQTCVGPCPGGGSTYTLDVVFATPMPGLTPYIGGSPVWGSWPSYGNPNIVFRNNCVHDMIGSLKFTAGLNALVQNNVFGNMYFEAIVSSFAPTLAANTGFSNLNVIGNRLVGVNYGQQDTNWLGVSSLGIQTGLPSGAIVQNSNATGFVPNAAIDSSFIGYPTSSFQYTNNFISNTPGLCVFIGASNNVSVTGNTCVDGNTVAYTVNYNTLYCGASSVGIPPVATPICPNYRAAQQSIFLTHITNYDVTSTSNVFMGTSQGGVFPDPGLVGTSPGVTQNNVVGAVYR